MLLMFAGGLVFMFGVFMKVEEDEQPKAGSNGSGLKGSGIMMISGASTMVIDAFLVRLIQSRMDLVDGGGRAEGRWRTNQKGAIFMLLRVIFFVGLLLFMGGVGLKMGEYFASHRQTHSHEAHSQHGHVFHATMRHLVAGVIKVSFGVPLLLMGFANITVLVCKNDFRKTPRLVVFLAAFSIMCIAVGGGLTVKGSKVLDLSRSAEQQIFSRPSHRITETSAIGMIFGGILSLLAGVLLLLPASAVLSNLSDHEYQHAISAPTEEDLNSERANADSEPDLGQREGSRSLELQAEKQIHRAARHFVSWLSLAVIFTGIGGTLIGVAVPAFRSAQRAERQRHSLPHHAGVSPNQHQSASNSLDGNDQMIVYGVCLFILSFIQSYASRKALAKKYGYTNKIKLCSNLCGQSGSDVTEEETGAYMASAKWRFAIDASVMIVRLSGIGLLIAGAVLRSAFFIDRDKLFHHIFVFEWQVWPGYLYTSRHPIQCCCRSRISSIRRYRFVLYLSGQSLSMADRA